MEHPTAEIVAQLALQWDRDAVVEEFSLSLVHPDAMTLLQAERIQYLFDIAKRRNTTPTPSEVPLRRRVLEQALDLAPVNYGIRRETSNRKLHLSRAMNNIPVRHMANWNTEQLETQMFRLGQEAMMQEHFVLRAYRRLHEIIDTLTPEQQQSMLTDLVEMTAQFEQDRQRGDDITSLLFQRRIPSPRFQRIQQRNQDSMAERTRLGLPNRKIAIAALLQAVSPSTLPKDDDGYQCNICMEPYRSAESLGIENYDGPEEVPVQLPCGHIYGKDCISAWLFEHSSCGFCRRDFSDELYRPLPQLPRSLTVNDSDDDSDYDVPDIESDGEGVAYGLEEWETESHGLMRMTMRNSWRRIRSRIQR